MCGIAGLFDTNSTPNVKTLERMNECVAHRGPDDNGVYTDGPVGLAHQRLSIIDLETGTQPIFNEDRSVVVIFNGEIYNHRALRDDLASSGHRFTTRTDTEVLVHAYEEHGLAFVERLEGMFAFALWDTQTERLVLARDPVGIKPLVFARSGGRTGFASELPALLASGMDHGGIDVTALECYFALGHVPAPYTAFDNVSKLNPGELVVVSEQGISRDRFHTFSPPRRAPGLGNGATELRKRVRRAVEERLQSDVPLGAFLSGGIDSSVVVGMMADLSDTPIDTFTVGFDESLFDESWAAREVADYHDTNHHEFEMSPGDVRELVPDVLARLGEPFADQSLLPSYVVAQETSRQVKVALSGDGADELFAGYDKYRAEYYSEYYRAFPSNVRSELIEPTINSLPASRGNRIATLIHQGQWVLNRSAPVAVPDRHFEWMRVPDGRAKTSFDSIDPLETSQGELHRQHDRLPAGMTERDALARIQAVDTQYSLPNQMLRKVDSASMYNSLEARAPLLDTDVVEYAMSLPTSYKITPRKRKLVFKHAFEDVLPDAILGRKKQGFDMPIGEWFKHELAAEFRSTVRSVDLGFLDDDAVLDVFREHVSGRRNHEKFLWTVYVFRRWARRMCEQGVLSAT
jgi:asparagine synthase (glutamine-hydrolysing)